ncbi:hypothetical protein FXO38_07896 [Capsicum annuum]|nr:hypothetical protein FXO38_07896 [Capsicum annuum]
MIEARCEGAMRCMTPRQKCLNLMASGATRIQILYGSWDSAIHTKYRILLHSSSMREPRYLLSRVVFCLQKKHRSPRRTSQLEREGKAIDLHIPWCFLRWGRGGGAHTECHSTPPARTPQFLKTFTSRSTMQVSTMILPQVSAQFGIIARLLVYPAFPVLISKNGPLGAHYSVVQLDKAAVGPTPKLDKRFARHYRYGPPPEFPLDSPHSGQTRWTIFQDGLNWEPVGQRSKHADVKERRRRTLPATIKEMVFHEHIKSPGFGRPPIHAGLHPESIRGPARRYSTSDRGASPSPIRFSPDGFKHSLSLFSKFFSSFPHGSGNNGALTLSGAPFQRVIPPDLVSRSEQMCPQPNGFGRSLRSNTLWFTGICNSHQVSHFATFFIDARAEEFGYTKQVSLGCGFAG